MQTKCILLKILLGIAMVACLAFGTTGSGTFSAGAGGGGGGECTLSSTLKQESEDTYWYDQYQSQKLKITAPTTVCKVELYLLGNADDLTGTVEFWSTINRTGTQYGSTSAVANIANDNTYHWVEFTFATNPVLTTDCYLHFIGSSWTTYLRWAIHSDETLYEDTNYDYGRSSDDNYDSCFRVYVE